MYTVVTLSSLSHPFPTPVCTVWQKLMTRLPIEHNNLFMDIRSKNGHQYQYYRVCIDTMGNPALEICKIDPFHDQIPDLNATE